MYYKIASILLNSEQKDGASCDIFIAQPDVHKEMLVGKLFVLAEIETQKSEGFKILNFLINNLSFNYYQNEKVILKEKIETISVENIFESALAKTNKDLAEFLEREKIKISPYAFNLTACVLYKNDLYLSSVGKNKILLVYKQKTALKPPRGRTEPELEKIEYKVTDLAKEAESDNSGISLAKLFSEVTCGKIPVGGYFLIINEALSEYLSHKQLIRIITKLSPASAAEQIKNMLEQINSVVSFLGVIVKNTVTANLSEEELKKRMESEIKNFNYQPEIITTEEKTEQILKPAGVINFKKWFKDLNESFRPKPKRTASAPGATGSKKPFFLKDKVFFKKRPSWLSIEKTIAAAKKIGNALSYLAVLSLKKTKKPEAGKTSQLGLPVENAPAGFLSPKRARIILGISILLIAVLAVNLTLTHQKNKKEEADRAFNALLASIEKNQNKIEADLLYGNEVEAGKLIKENQDLLGRIPAEEAEKREQVRSLIEKQAGQIEKMRHVAHVTETKKIADFSNLNSAAAPQNLTFLSDKLYAADAAGRSIYKIDLKENLVTAIYDIEASSGLSFPAIGGNDNIYYFSGQDIIELDKGEKISKLPLPNPSPAENIAAAKSYNEGIYLLNKKDGQIYRYKKLAESFGNQTEWLEEKADLANAADIFIDGDLYILYGDGRVEKYQKGLKKEFSLPPIEEAVAGANRLFGGEKHFYVFESGKKRLAVFTREGKFVEQKIFESLDSVRDLEINERDKKIYLLSGASVFETDLNLPE